MKKLYMGQKMIVSALAGMILIPGSVVRIQAAENEEQQSVVPTAQESNRHWKSVTGQK